MKPLVFIISIYFLFLAVMPCNCHLQTVDTKDYKTELVSISVTDHNLDQDTCTPFCACSGFHYTNFIAKNEVLLHVVNTPIEQLSLYREETPPSYINSLWRPPKV